jgi:phage terminase large subunit
MLRRQPEWMLPDGFNWARDSLFMRMVNPATGAMISGEGGEDMGRGGRSSLYIVDEAAFLPNAESVEKALSGNTDCVGWVSSVNGMGNLFARKRHSILKKDQVFRLHWRDDPRKTEEWAAAKEASFSDPAAWASEYEIDYSASLEGVCIPAKWVEAAKRIASSIRRSSRPTRRWSASTSAPARRSRCIVRNGRSIGVRQSRGDPDTTGHGIGRWSMPRRQGAKR